MKIEVDTSVTRNLMGPSTYTTRVTIEATHEDRYGVPSNPPIPQTHLVAALAEARKSVVAAIDAHKAT